MVLIRLSTEMNIKVKYACAIVASLALLGCDSEKWPAQPDWSQFPNPDETEKVLKPAACDNKIVAHRLGASECGAPDNSVEALRYAMTLGVFGAECDAYVTKDNEVIIAHANGMCEVNGRLPYKTDLADIRSAGKLSNGEVIPTLEDLLDIVMDEKNPTRLIIDIKRVDYPTNNPEAVSKCAKRICEIVSERKAKNFVMLLCTGFDKNAMNAAWGYAKAANLEIAFNTSRTADEMVSLGYNWINLAATQIGGDAGGSGYIPSITPYLEAGINVSIYNLDKQAGDGNAVYSSKAVKWYQENYASLKSLSTNYPAWLKEVIESGANKYDGISTQEEFETFASSLVSDPTGSAFTDNNGVVNLKANVVTTSACALKEFKGVFDGGSHTVTINYDGEADEVSLFGTLQGTVRNLNVAGKVNSEAKGDTYIFGGIAANADEASFENCTSSVQVLVKGETTSAVNIGGIAGIASGVCGFSNCKNTGSIAYEGTSALNLGGIIASNKSDNGKVTISNCISSCTIDFSGNSSGWNYVGGIIGKLASKTVASDGGKDYVLVLDNCSYTDEFKVNGKGKIRAGMLVAYSNAYFVIRDCSASGSLINENSTARDFVAASMIGFIEKNVEGTITGCEFTGKVESCAGSNNYIGGIMGNTADNCKVVCDNCRTGADSSVGSDNVKSVGMIACRLKTSGCSIKNCRIAGKVNNGGKQTIITKDNLEDWMFCGTGTKSVDMSGNGYNE